MPKLSQETLAVIGASVGLAALILTSTAGIRAEIQTVRTEIQDVRAEARADRGALRAEMRADREALRAETRADRETFERHIIRLTEQQGILSGHVESIRNQLATTR